MAQSEVTMTVSVGGDLVAGESYQLPIGEADRLILKGYAEGELSRQYTDDEIHDLTALDQTAGV